MIGLVILTLIPIFYIARSKGYNALVLCIVCGLIGTFTPHFLHYFRGWPFLPIADLTIPFIVLAIVWLLPTRKGAPGKQYLRINFNCPECHAAVTFKRHEEGTAVLCPKCGEIITVPTDEYSKVSTRKRQRPRFNKGKASFDSFGNEMAALEMQALLEGHGIEAEIIDGTGGGVLQQLGSSQGYRVVIDVEDWDKAETTIKESQQIDQR